MIENKLAAVSQRGQWGTGNPFHKPNEICSNELYLANKNGLSLRKSKTRLQHRVSFPIKYDTESYITPLADASRSLHIPYPLECSWLLTIATPSRSWLSRSSASALQSALPS
ncbi:hypothetical protein Rcae01_02236 [Novipirellula caenicola]|uniref:Uncharacterized protein n=1 Tax=Novipirellula caenicola TaxID=1536901 RepID=A0ABP9VTF3_9BACT